MEPNHDILWRYVDDHAVCGFCGKRVRWISRLLGWVHISPINPTLSSTDDETDIEN